MDPFPNIFIPQNMNFNNPFNLNNAWMNFNNNSMNMNMNMNQNLNYCQMNNMMPNLDFHQNSINNINQDNLKTQIQKIIKN